MLPDRNLIVLRFPHDYQFVIEIYALRVYEACGAPAAGDIVVDIGANIGVFTLRASKLIGEKGKVIAIEPSADNFDYLQRNARLNRARNISCIKSAISDFDGRAHLYSTVPYGGYWTLTPQSGGIRELVQVSTLDNLLERQRIRHVNFLKIDAEGAELNVLRGAKRTLASPGRVRISVAAYHYPNEAVDISTFLQNLGFLIYVREDPGLYVYAFSDKNSYGNLE